MDAIIKVRSYLLSNRAVDMCRSSAEYSVPFVLQQVTVTAALLCSISQLLDRSRDTPEDISHATDQLNTSETQLCAKFVLLQQNSLIFLSQYKHSVVQV